MKTPSKITALKFIFTWFTSLAVIIFLIYPAFTTCYITYIEASPALNIAKAGYKVKNKISKRFEHEPILYIVGGSSALHGISASLMDNKLKRRVINYGVHGGLGLEYQLKKLTSRLKPNDSVLLAFEFSLLTDKTNKFRDFLLHYVFTYDPAYLLELEAKRSLELIYGIPFLDFYKSTTKYVSLIDGENRKKDYSFILNNDRGDRGDFLTYRKKRPLKEIPFKGLGVFSKEVLNCFFKEAKKKNIDIFWTWGTAYKNDFFFTKQAADKYKSFLNYLNNHNINVLDSYTEHLYPEIFYTDSYNHLSTAGKRIRTEKIIQSIRPYLNPNISSKKSWGIFILDPDTHIINQNKIFQNIDFDYRILGNQNTDGLILNWEDITKSIKNNKEKIYFSDNSLKQKAAVNNFGFNRVKCNTRSLATDITRYTNHIFLLIYKNITTVDQNTAMDLPDQFSKALQNTGYRTIVIGTGKYSKINIVHVNSSIVKSQLNKNDKIGGYKLPFKVNMLSTGLNVKPFQRCQLNINNRSFLKNNKSGLAVLVFDPEIEIVVDYFLYKNLKEQESDCIYELSETSLSHKTQILSSDGFVLTGKTKPELTVKENSSVIQFKGKSSLFGYRLTSDSAKKGILIMNVRKKSGGRVKAGLKTNVPGFFRSHPVTQILDNSDNWQKISIAFELFPNTAFKKKEWAFLGIWGSDSDTHVQVKDMKIIWQRQDLSKETSK